MIWKKEWIKFIDATQFSTEFMALNRTFSWHGMDGTQFGIEKDGLQSLVLHPWVLALYIRINILFTWLVLQALAFSETFFPSSPLLYFLLKEYVKQLSPVLYVSYYYSLKAWIYSLVSYTFSIQVYYKFSSSLTLRSMSWTVNLCIYLCVCVLHILFHLNSYVPFQNLILWNLSLKSWAILYHIISLQDILHFVIQSRNLIMLCEVLLFQYFHISFTLERLLFDSTFVLMAYRIRLFHQNILIMWR